MRRHPPEPFTQYCRDRDTGCQIERGRAETTKGETALDLIDWGGRRVHSAKWRLCNRPAKSSVLVQAVGRARRNGGKARQKQSVVADQPVLLALAIGQCREEAEEITWKNGGLDNADEFSVAFEPPAY